ncbi:tyrosine-protein phosphatase SIW14 [Bimuria novae-zelandiae CBS 107.79]|uniref:Tyrosine-protein phosphatase SIW14 n=1 Tax=Bimuria novae-zelandiae CBS 107.79 TaxID=1447943 RepID=A0A6A5V2K7_9PLEO|nr:tyrosine-protein phosphatase SIW14 [Bimuria novae-zelandiae CBS 107.79]
MAGNMSTNKVEQPTAQSSLFANIKSYFANLGLASDEHLTEHAACTHHEDLPVDPSGENIDTAKTRTPSPITETIAPGRLRSLYPPSNYGAVVPGAVYRSSYPQEKNFDFLESLKLKTIITLVPEEIPAGYRDWMNKAGVQHFQVHLNANKGAVRIQSCDINRALNIVLDRTNHPILIHCNKGKHRTGCLVATLRRIQGYDSDFVRHEYHVYADPKARFWDEVFFENFDTNTVMWHARKENWIAHEVEGVLLSPPPSPVSSMYVAKPST